MFIHSSYLQTLGRSVCNLGDRVSIKLQNKTSPPIESDDDESTSSSDNKPTLKSSASSPIFSTFFSVFSPGSYSGFKRPSAIHEEYKNYINNPTFYDRELVYDLELTKNKDIEQPSKPMLHPVLLEPHTLKKHELNKSFNAKNVD